MAPHGTSKAYILGRLRREGRTDFVEAIAAGKITALAAACELGWVTRPSTLSVLTNQAKQRQRQFRAIAGDNRLGVYQELWLGPGHNGSVFESREELLAAWEQHRAEVMRLWGSHGRRPMAWWEFDAGDPEHPGRDRERSVLWRANVLSEAERGEVESEWREAYDAAKGKAALERRAAYRFADIPDELVERWQGARKRRRRRPAAVEEAARPAQPGSHSG
jgi:hypothetical protein